MVLNLEILFLIYYFRLILNYTQFHHLKDKYLKYMVLEFGVEKEVNGRK
jgi:hypothetical protein